MFFVLIPQEILTVAGASSFVVLLRRRAATAKRNKQKVLWSALSEKAREKQKKPTTHFTDWHGFACRRGSFANAQVESSAALVPRRLQRVVRLLCSNRLFQQVKRHRPLRLLYTIVPIVPVALEVRVCLAVQTDVALV